MIEIQETPSVSVQNQLRGQKNMPTLLEKAAEIAAWNEAGRKILPKLPFENRGLSARTIDALVAGGIDAPERLLFATEAELNKLSGIGKVSLDEIMRYRLRFLPTDRL